MAREVRKFAVTIPKNTLKTAPQISSLAFPDRVVQEVEIVVPPGPRGEVGFQLATGGSQVLPSEAGAYFVTDNEFIRWPLEEQIDTGAWQLIAYNTGNFAHTLEIRFLVTVVRPADAGRSLLPLGAAALSSPAGGATIPDMQTPLAFLGMG